MSSTYGLICLNHDPGIEIGDHTIDHQADGMLAAARDPAGHDWDEHARCDLVVAAYSYPIVRIGCAGRTAGGAGCRRHDGPRWIERDLLRLLIAAYQAGDAVPGWATEPYSASCWGRERALRLGPLLGLEKAAGAPLVDETVDPPAPYPCCSNCGKPVGALPDGTVQLAFTNADGSGVTCSVCRGVMTLGQALRHFAQTRYA